MEADLLALLVEVTSVPAAGKQIKKPITLKRPHEEPGAAQDPKARRPATKDEVDRAFKRGIGVLAATARAV